MRKIFAAPHRPTLAACGLLLLLATAALAASFSQRVQKGGRQDKGDTLEQVKQTPEQHLRVAGNEDCPLRIVEAKVKEIPGHLFTKLTGKVTDLAAVSSYPEVTLVNASGQTVTKFFFAIRDPKTQHTRGLIRYDLSIKPGETYLLTRDSFLTPEKTTVADASGVREQKALPGIDSEKAWMQFAARSDVFVAIAKVEFQDGSNWVLKEGGEVK